MKYTLKRASENPLLKSKNNIVVEINNEFINLSGYNKNELMGKSLFEVSAMLRIDSQINLESIQGKHRCYMFSKEYEPIEINISCTFLQCGNEKNYFFKERPCSRIEDKLPNAASLFADNDNAIAVYSITDGILLKANDKFFDFENIPGNKRLNYIGRFPENNESCFQKALLKVVETGDAFYSRKSEWGYFQKGDTYWDISIVPIYISGKAKCILHTASEITEKILNRKYIEEQARIVKEQKEELEAVLENMSDGIYIADKDLKMTPLNSSVRDLAYRPDNIYKVGASLSDTKYYDSEGNLLLFENFPACRVLKGETVRDFRFTSHRPDGIFHYSSSGSPLYDKSGNVVKAVICARDVTEHVTKDELIRRQKEQLETIIENMSEALLFFNKDGNITKVNKSAKNTGFDFTGIKRVGDFFNRAEITDLKGNLISSENSPFQRLLEGEKISNYQAAVKINNLVNYIEMNGSSIYDDAGNFIAGIAIIHDVTDRIKNEEALLLKAQFHLLNSMIENLEIPVFRFSYPEFIIKDFNHEACNYMRWYKPQIKSMKSIIGRNFLDFVHVQSRLQSFKIVRKVWETRQSSYINVKRLTTAGEERFFKQIYQPVLGYNNEVIEIALFIVDTTEEVAARNKMEEALKIQDEIFANISHELKTPLNVIFSATQLVEFYLKNDLLEANKEKVCKDINIIKQNCYRFTKLINNIVDMSKIDSGFFKVNLSDENIVQVTEEIVQSVSEYIEKKGLSIVFDTDVEEKIIACDPEKIERIILNLISNAVKFTNSDGRIFVNILDKGDTVEIAVKDTGIGMNKRDLDNIFMRFHQVDKSLSRNTEGSGIGLSLVKSIVDLHGGKIYVESSPGEGSIFTISLPALTVKNAEVTSPIKADNNKVEMIKIEFSDIYGTNKEEELCPTGQ